MANQAEEDENVREITVENISEKYDTKKLEQKFFIYGDISKIEYDKKQVSFIFL
jgi:hypothetical protein